MKKTLFLNLLFVFFLLNIEITSAKRVKWCRYRCLKKKNSCCDEKYPKTCMNLITSKEKLQQFRKSILELHNNFRNKIANKDPKVLKWIQLRYFTLGIKNANVLNYDLELEKLAHCQSKRCISKQDSDRCRITPTKFWIYQIALGHKTRISSIEALSKLIESMPNVKTNDLLNYFPHKFYVRDERNKFPPVLHMLWAKYEFVGCWESWDLSLKRANPYMLTCNYYGHENLSSFHRISPYDIGASQCKNRAVCPNGCDKSYPALCGHLKKIPEGFLPGDIGHEFEIEENKHFLSSSRRNYFQFHIILLLLIFSV